MNNEFDDRAAREVRAEATYPVFGRKVDVRFLGHDARALAEESFGGWNTLEAQDIAPHDAAECSVIVMPAGTAIPGAPEYAVSEEDLVVPDGTVTMFVDRGDQRGCILAPRAALEETPRAFQKLYLEAAVQFLASAEDRVPMHMAGAVIAGHTLFIAGPSGSGTICMVRLPKTAVNRESRSKLPCESNPIPPSAVSSPEQAALCPRRR